MINTSPLGKKAIKAAKHQDWDKAVEINQSILDEDPKNINALNRIALAYMQQDHPRLARRALKKVLELDKHNKIAQKNLKRVKNKETSRVKFSKGSYIEEPGKAKNIELLRLTEEENLKDISLGQECYLDPKKTYVSVYVKDDDQYLGAIPEDISERLIKLIKTGNKYECIIQNCETNQCVVHVKEKKVSPENEGLHSFSIEDGGNSDHIKKIADHYKVKDDIPVEIVNTDEDVSAKQRKFRNLD